MQTKKNIIVSYKTTSWAKSFWMLILFLWAGLATPLAKFYSPEFPYIVFINLVICAYYYIRYGRSKNNSLLILIAGYGLWYALICMKYGAIQKTDFTLVYSALIGFITFKVFPSIKEFFAYFESVLVKLCMLSLFVWLSVTLFPFMASVYDGLAIYKTDRLESSNFILVGYGHQMAGIFHRNLGFAWEAGRFASFIVLGLFFNLHRYKLNIKYKTNKNFWILLFTLVTTFSTTGFAALGGVILFYFFNKSVYSKVILIIVGVLAFPTIVALPFIGDKITENMDYNQEMSNMMYSFTEWGTPSITPQRITGFYLELLNFVNDPLLGYNINEESYVMSNIFKGFNVWLSDGFLQIFSKYGLFMGAFFYYNLSKTSIFLSKLYSMKGKFFFLLVFVLISFSYDFWGTGLTFYMVFYTFFVKNNKLKNYAN